MYPDADLIAFHGAPLNSVATDLTGAFAAISRYAASTGVFPVALLAILAGMIWNVRAHEASWVYALLAALRTAVRRERFRKDQSIHFRNALLSKSRQAIVILGTDMTFGDGNALLRQCVTGPDAVKVTDSLDALLKTGRFFELSARAANGGVIAIRGLPVGHRAVLYLQDEGATDAMLHFREILDALPTPVWVRGSDLSLRWGNRAFLAAVGLNKLQNALASNAALDRSENELAAAALDSHSCVEARKIAVVNGQRRALAMSFSPLPGAGVAGMAADISDVTRAEAALQHANEAHSDMMERLPLGVATFDAGQRLAGYNSAYAQLWGFSEAWLDTHPSHTEILNRLRENRKLPEQRDFAAWNQDQLNVFAISRQKTEEFWHLPGGKSLRIVTQPHLQGGIFMLFEDISERLHLETSLKLLTQVQKATLDTLDEAIAIFGTDGRLVLHNAHFAKLWHLMDDELSGHPHFTDIAGSCDARIGRDDVWSIVAAGVSSMEPERRGKWGKAERADGRILSLSISRLPNGATIVTFIDLTDLERFEAEQRELLLGHAPADVKANRKT
ncbi:MAG TPA: PAS-domain containing protein [Rhizomicrobium sp.]|nr:PAS-domain containing protein [Rhizomicrobium sp.]